MEVVRVTEVVLVTEGVRIVLDTSETVVAEQAASTHPMTKQKANALLRLSMTFTGIAAIAEEPSPETPTG